MANFIPQWSSTVSASEMIQGTSTDIEIIMKKSTSDTSGDNQYNVDDDQFLEINFKVSSSGNTFDIDNYTITAGESESTLLPINEIDSSYNSDLGTYTVVLNKKAIDLSDATQETMYIIRVLMIDTGTWHSVESITVVLNYTRINTQDSAGNIISIQNSGSITTDSTTITYPATNEFWVTPGITVYGDKKSSIGSIAYGSESRLFVQAFGKKRLYDVDIDSTGAYPDDTSPRVYIPAYNAEFNSSAYVPTSHISGSGTYITPSVTTAKEEVVLNIYDSATNSIIKTGLTFLFNGQIVQTSTYDSEPVDAYIRVKIIDALDVWETDSDRFYEGKRFRAYQYWIAPDDVSTFDSTDVKPGHLYMLKDTTVYPYVVKTAEDEYGNDLLVFDSTVWLDMGVYDASVGEGIIGLERMFRIVMNSNEGDDLVITTDSDLGEIRCGEYFGHSVYPKIQATGDSLITFSLSDDSTDDIRQYGLDLSADGLLYGTCIAKSTEFDSNDFIVLNFNINAHNRKGRTVEKAFTLRIDRGFGEHFMSAYAVPSRNLERLWFETISTSVFSKMKYYRRSDPRYGLQRLPRILLKENFLDSTETFVSLKDTKSKLRNGILRNDTLPEGSFKLSIGNYKVRSAIDNDGNVIYDVLYCELLPYGYTSQASLDMYDYSSNEDLVELYGLRENIKQVIGEDTYNISLDPDDFENRALNIPEYTDLSSAMIDTLPRHMVHPSTDNGATAGLMFIIPVAYLEPGAGESLFAELAQANEHLALLNTTVDVQAIQFMCYSHVSTNTMNIADSFNINL